MAGLNRREVERRERDWEQAQYWTVNQTDQLPDPLPSDNGFQWLPEYSEQNKGRVAFPTSRVSPRDSSKLRSGLDILRIGCEAALRYGHPIVAKEWIEASGYMIEDSKYVLWLRKQVKKAIRLGAFFIVETVSRPIRNQMYREDNQLSPNQEDYDFYRELTYPVDTVTIHHPDISMSEERSIQTKRGQRLHGKGGRPAGPYRGYKKEYREKHLPEVLHLFGLGMSYSHIEALTGVRKPTVQLWVKRTLEGGPT